MTSPKTAVIGAAGLLGRHLLSAVRRVHPDAVGTDHLGRGGLAKLDLASPDAAALGLARSGHRWAVIAAVGSKDYAACEARPDHTRARNVEGTLELARQLAGEGLGVVFISSDGVFRGDRGGYSDLDPLDPINEYGRQKVEVERRLPDATGGRCMMLRIGRLFGARKGDGTLPDEIAARVASGGTVDAARDQVFNPTLLDDLPRALAALQAADARGPFNVAAPDPWRRLDVARRLAAGLGRPQAVREISLDDLGDGVPRPKDLSLRCDRLASELGLTLSRVDPCLEAVIANYRTQGEPVGS